MVIRRSEPQDMPQLTAIWLQASLHADEFLPAATWWHRQESMRKQLECGTEVWVADDEDHLVGFVALKADELLELYVEPTCPRQQLAEELLGLVKRHHPILYHRACADHVDEIEFYQKQGFKIKEAHKHPVWQLDEYWMECRDA
ncbi:GNAT family N-acetyltransferase [Tolumonas lignilytica]|jgi:hypothetical protein|uniref:GNAT family N-acetyltransferase n=1 Tax=Tolumonas lignilytica TaxID=1283284 RepID=UPI00046375ED|nr:GNAT family N-acetyltransferase [Tolumonas lignilytica]